MKTRYFVFMVSVLMLGLLFLIPGCASSAGITVSLPVISAGPIIAGQPVTINVGVANPGKSGSSAYALTLQINNADVETKEGTIDGGKNETIGFSYTPETAGLYNVRINGGEEVTFTALKPAEFTIEEVDISSSSITIGQEIETWADITNKGDIAGVYSVLMKVNGSRVESEDRQVQPGETVTVRYSYTPEETGTITLEFCGSEYEIEVKEKQTVSVAEPEILQNPYSIFNGEWESNEESGGLFSEPVLKFTVENGEIVSLIVNVFPEPSELFFWFIEPGATLEIDEAGFTFTAVSLPETSGEGEFVLTGKFISENKCEGTMVFPEGFFWVDFTVKQEVVYTWTAERS